MSAATDAIVLDAPKPAPRRRFLLYHLLIGICVVFGLPGCFASDSLVNRKAPEFVRKDLNGARLHLKNFRGKVVLLNFWATWCAPCQVDLPVFAAWQQQFGPEGLQIIAISMDDNVAPARKLVSELKLNYPVAMGDARLGERYGGVLGLPMTFLVDRDGVVRARFQGETNLKTIEAELKMLLAR